MVAIELLGRDDSPMKCRVMTFVAVIALGVTAFASGAEDEIRQLYRRALGGDKSAVEPCIAKLQVALKEESGNQLARVTLGSALTLRSRDMGFGPTKLRTLNEGVAAMNTAVAAAPNDAHVRLIRALTLDALPSLLGHKGETRADFAWLKEVVAEHPERLTPDEQRTLREQLSKLAH